MKSACLLGVAMLWATGTRALSQSPAFQFTSASYAVSETSGVAAITVHFDWGGGDPFSIYTVDYATSNGTAAAGLDYAATNGTLSFAYPETNQFFAVPIVDNDLFKADNTVRLMLSNPSLDAIVAEPNAAVLAILDNDHPLENWTLRSVLPISKDLRSIAYGNGTFVSVEYNQSGWPEKPLTSADGITWTRHPEVEYDLSSLTYADGRFLAIGFDAFAVSRCRYILSSVDGANWTPQQLCCEKCNWGLSLETVVAGAGRLVVTGHRRDDINHSSGVIFSSADGQVWHEIDVGPGSWGGIAYGAGKFVAPFRSEQSLVWVSTNGVNWTNQVIDAIPAGITFLNDLFVADEELYGTNILVSPDGITWIAQPIGASSFGFSAAYGNGIYAAMRSEVIGRGPDSRSVMLTSTDGIHWSTNDPGTPRHLFSLAFGAGKFVAVGDCETILISPDAVHWTNLSSNPCELSFLAAVYGMNSLVTVGSMQTRRLGERQGAIATFRNSGQATLQSWGMVVALNGVVYGAAHFVAVGDGGTILNSCDGVNWAAQNSGINQPLSSVTYGGGLFVAVGGSSDGLILTSNDGTNWTQAAVPTNQVAALRSATYGNGLFVAAGDYHTVMVSSNGTEWVSHQIPDTPSFLGRPPSTSIVYGNDVFVAACENCFRHAGLVCREPGFNFFVSSNGVDWAKTASAGGLSVALACGGGLFAAWLGGGSLIVSEDGTRWSTLAPNFSNAIYGLAHRNDRFLAVGEGGTVLESGGLGPRFVTPIPPSPHGNMRLVLKWWWPNAKLSLQTSLDVQNWTRIGTATNTTGTLEFNDAQAGDYPRRFYRAVATH